MGQYQAKQRQTQRAVVVALVALMLGCVSGKSLQDRHSMSRLWADADGTIVFEASISPDYPLDSDVAEAEREKWIAQWLERKRMCANGFEIIDRVGIGSAADNPYQHDLRYRLRCRTT